LETAPATGSALRLEVVATDADENLLDRARTGRYTQSSLKDLPDDFREKAFTAHEDPLTIRDSFKHGVSFVLQDIREEVPDGSFDIVLCRNLAFTYFDDKLQFAVLDAIRPKLLPGGFLIVGIHESLPRSGAERTTLTPFEPVPGVYTAAPSVPRSTA
jgi:chemotaxis protein methyltransferase CheR